MSIDQIVLAIAAIGDESFLDLRGFGALADGHQEARRAISHRSFADVQVEARTEILGQRRSAEGENGANRAFAQPSFVELLAFVHRLESLVDGG